MSKPAGISLTLLMSALLLAGCSLAPHYARPDVAAPAAFKEAAGAADAAAWKPAEPAEASHRGEWWLVFADESLNALQRQADAANQDLRAAAARLAQARALQQRARADRFPQVGAGFGPTRQRPSPASAGLPANADTAAATLWRAQVDIAYEVDLFGRVAAAQAAAGADAQRSEALFRSVRLALQADVAQTYFTIRELDAEQALFETTVGLRGQALALVERRFAAGDISELDVARARAELASSESEREGILHRRATAEHALAVLLGRAPADFDLPALPLAPVMVSVPAGLPSALLERRPDIAAAERAMAAANARIGVARAAWFPRLSLTGALGFESAELGDLSRWSSRTFLFGPLAGTMLSLPLFDGGARRAGVERARAIHEEEVAVYRQTVLNAFREVEDSLAGLRLLAGQIQAQARAVQASARAAQLSQIQYREGSVNFLDVIDADRSVLQQRRVAVQLEGERARAAVSLIRALGGGWEAAQTGSSSGRPVVVAHLTGE